MVARDGLMDSRIMGTDVDVEGKLSERTMMYTTNDRSKEVQSDTCCGKAESDEQVFLSRIHIYFSIYLNKRLLYDNMENNYRFK